MENDTIFEFKIIKSKRINRKNLYYIIFIPFFLLATFILFLPWLIGIERNTIPFFIKLIALLIYLGGMTLFSAESYFRPKRLGFLRVLADKIEIYAENSNKEIPFTTIEYIELSYTGYTSKFFRPYGNWNFLRFVTGQEDSIHEISLKSKEEKESLKTVLKKFKTQGINTKIKYKTMRPF